MRSESSIREFGNVLGNSTFWKFDLPETNRQTDFIFTQMYFCESISGCALQIVTRLVFNEEHSNILILFSRMFFIHNSILMYSLQSTPRCAIEKLYE